MKKTRKVILIATLITLFIASTMHTNATSLARRCSIVEKQCSTDNGLSRITLSSLDIIIVPLQYPTIQEAIDNASDGDTIYVLNGTYYENIVINKSITLIGENKETTIIDGGGNGNVAAILASEISISGFTIQHSGNSTGRDKGVSVMSNYNVINGSILTNNYIGFGLSYSSNNNTITNNILTKIVARPFLLTNSSNNTIAKNLIIDNGASLDIYARSNNNLISNNTFVNNTDGIWLYHSSYNTVIGNRFEDNKYTAIGLGNSSYTTIKQNIIINNIQGIEFIYLSNNNLVIQNKIEKNRAFGISLAHSYTNIITNNNFNNGPINAIFRGTSISEDKNIWESNYWGRPRILPKPIFGTMYIGHIPILWLNFDWHPAQEPYEI